MIPCISALFPERIGCSQWPTSQCNELLNSDCCFIQCRLSTDGWGGGSGAGTYAYLPLWLDARFRSSSSLAARPVTPDPLSPLPAPFGVHAQQHRARNRLETVWSLSEIDKIGNGVLHRFARFRGSRVFGKRNIFSPPPTPSPTTRHAQTKYSFFR